MKNELKELQQEVERLRDAIRRHRDYRGNHRCWKDNLELYSVLPEGVAEADLKLPEPLEMMGECLKYIQHCHNPSEPYISSQTVIESLEKENVSLKSQLNDEFKRGKNYGYKLGYADGQLGVEFDSNYG